MAVFFRRVWGRMVGALERRIIWHFLTRQMLVISNERDTGSLEVGSWLQSSVKKTDVTHVQFLHCSWSPFTKIPHLGFPLAHELHWANIITIKEEKTESHGGYNLKLWSQTKPVISISYFSLCPFSVVCTKLITTSKPKGWKQWLFWCLSWSRGLGLAGWFFGSMWSSLGLQSSGAWLGWNGLDCHLYGCVIFWLSAGVAAWKALVLQVVWASHSIVPGFWELVFQEAGSRSTSFLF